MPLNPSPIGQRPETFPRFGGVLSPYRHSLSLTRQHRLQRACGLKPCGGCLFV